MKKLSLLFVAILTYTSSFAIVDNPPPKTLITSSETFTTPAQEYKFKPYTIQTEGFFYPRHSDRFGFKPLGLAIWNGDHKEVQRLLDSGVSPNELQTTMTPLGIAVQGDNIEAFNILMNHKDINVNQFYTVIVAGDRTSSTKLTAIADAIELGNPEMMRMLLDKGAKVDYVYETIDITSNPNILTIRRTPLMAGFGRIGYYYYKAKNPTSKFNVLEQFAQLQRIADKTTDINREFMVYSTEDVGPGNIPHKTNIPYTSSPNSLLMQIIFSNNYLDTGSPFRKEINKIIFSLIERGADPDYGYYANINALVKLMQFGGADNATIEVLKANAKYNRTSVIGMAVYGCNAPLVRYLLDKGASTSTGGDKGGVLFITIISPGVLNAFIDHGLDINTVNHDGYGLLFSAVKSETGLLEEMLKLGANPNLTIKGLGNVLTFTGGTIGRKRKEAVVNMLKSYGAVEYVAVKVNPVKTTAPSAKEINAMKFAILNPNDPNVKGVGVTATADYRKHNKYVVKMEAEVAPLYKQLVARPTAVQWNKIVVAMEKVINDVNAGR